MDINNGDGFTTVTSNRKRINTGGTSSKNITDKEYNEMSTDDKFSLMFKQMKSIGQKVDDSLLLHNTVHNIESCLSDYDKRLKVLE